MAKFYYENGGKIPPLRQNSKVKTVTTIFNGKSITTNILYRYILDKESGSITWSSKEIIEVRANRIKFFEGNTVSTSVINSITNGLFLYLPVDDIEYAIDKFKSYYENRIKENEMEHDELMEICNRIKK